MEKTFSDALYYFTLLHVFTLKCLSIIDTDLSEREREIERERERLREIGQAREQARECEGGNEGESERNQFLTISHLYNITHTQSLNVKRIRKRKTREL